MANKGGDRKKGRLFYWLPVLGWLVLIFLASTDEMSAGHTSRFVEPLLHWLDPEMSAAALDRAHYCVRKAAHVTEYAILAILLSRALTVGMTPLTGRKAALVLALAATYAASDEFHQTFVPSRGASVHDVGFDSAGAALGLAIMWFSRRRHGLIKDAG